MAIYTLDGVETSQTISADTGANYYIAGENTPKSMVTLTTNDRMTVETLKAVESIYGTYRYQFNAPGDINREGGVTEFSYDARGQIISMTKKGETEGYDVTLSMTILAM